MRAEMKDLPLRAISLSQPLETAAQASPNFSDSFVLSEYGHRPVAAPTLPLPTPTASHRIQRHNEHSNPPSIGTLAFQCSAPPRKRNQHVQHPCAAFAVVHGIRAEHVCTRLASAHKNGRLCIQCRPIPNYSDAAGTLVCLIKTGWGPCAKLMNGM
ncbi:hypothetical protein BC830DRAFT_36359 [Chytriomyces sp. MP71]|nr:hypothetical protein BC830DRAFT_36359 [Chytriomyces sp. MP71]